MLGCCMRSCVFTSRIKYSVICCSRTFFFGISLIAKSSAVCLCTTFRTWPYEPLPMGPPKKNWSSEKRGRDFLLSEPLPDSATESKVPTDAVSAAGLAAGAAAGTDVRAEARGESKAPAAGAGGGCGACSFGSCGADAEETEISAAGVWAVRTGGEYCIAGAVGSSGEYCIAGVVGSRAGAGAGCTAGSGENCMAVVVGSRSGVGAGADAGCTAGAGTEFEAGVDDNSRCKGNSS
mmetsp:Transcript_50641/g.84130  ORF Transcript_50641/g.84130 Transcript_50641/m.84130 type:complete len:235 (-) Transcript_50641:335-1039(-)